MCDRRDGWAIGPGQLLIDKDYIETDTLGLSLFNRHSA